MRTQLNQDLTQQARSAIYVYTAEDIPRAYGRASVLTALLGRPGDGNHNRLILPCPLYDAVGIVAGEGDLCPDQSPPTKIEANNPALHEGGNNEVAS